MPPPPPLHRTGEATEHASEIPFEVLITGFGPFGDNPVNPSWSIASLLHDITLIPSIPQGSSARKIHIQSINLPVSYPNTLEAVPRIHNLAPFSPFAAIQLDPRGPEDGAQGDGKRSFPLGYSPRLQHPKHGYDLVIHVGVGLNGGYRIEKQAHKDGYKGIDALGQKAPPVDNAPEGEGGGFGRGYEDFDSLLKSGINVEGLVAYLDSQGCGPIFSSADPGRYLCDFTYYTSLAAAQRASSTVADGEGIGEETAQKERTHVLFIHVPKVGQPQTVQDGVKMLERAIGWILWGQ